MLRKFFVDLKEELLDFDMGWVRFTAIAIRLFVIAWVISVPFVWSIKHL